MRLRVIILYLREVKLYIIESYYYHDYIYIYIYITIITIITITITITIPQAQSIARSSSSVLLKDPARVEILFRGQ